MKKTYSLIKACMTSDMALFKVKTKNNRITIPIIIALFLMFSMWANANVLFEQIAPLHLEYIIIALAVFITSLMTIIEGIYKSGPLLFNCKDDELLLSLPIKKKLILFVRILKFYIFELLFNSLFIIPVIIAYLRWAEVIDWTFFLTSFVMIITLPIIPIIISCLIGYFLTSVSSKFKHKNIIQIIFPMLFVLLIMYFSFNTNNLYEYIVENATSINDMITKIYYPAGVYVSLITKFNIFILIKYILINILLLFITILFISKSYFNINSRLKSVSTAKTNNNSKIMIQSHSSLYSLIKKELNMYFNTPVLIINAGLGLVLFIIICIIICFKFDSVLLSIVNTEDINISIDIILNNLSILILVLISLTSFMTSITNSSISLEGRNINILKSLPIKYKNILLSKIYACLIITTPVLIVGNLILFIKFKIKIIEMILLIILSILIPLISHFIGLIVNLKFPKLDAENSTEIVKQSTSSFISVMIGLLLFVLTSGIILKIVGKYSSTIILLIAIAIYLLIDIILYIYLVNKGTKDFNNLSI